MSEGFERELAALREEVGKFILEVLTKDNDRLLDDVAAGLSRRLNRSVNLNAALDEGDRRLLRELLADLRRARPDRDLATAPPDDSASLLPHRTFAEQQLRDEPGEPPETLPRWRRNLRTMVIGAVVGLITLVVVSIFLMTPGPGISRLWTAAQPTEKSGQSAPAVSPSDEAGTIEAGWSDVLDAADSLPEPERDQTILALCGANQSRTTCPSFDDRQQAWAKDHAEEDRAMKTLRKMLDSRFPCLKRVQTATPSEPASVSGTHQAVAPTPDAGPVAAFAGCLLAEPSP